MMIDEQEEICCRWLRRQSMFVLRERVCAPLSRAALRRLLQFVVSTVYPIRVALSSAPRSIVDAKHTTAAAAAKYDLATSGRA